MPQNTVEKYAVLHRAWHEAIYGEDVNSINNQLVRFAYDMMRYRVINDAREYAQTDHESRPMLNPLLHGLLNRCYIDSAVLSVRRLSDSFLRNDPKRAVHSITSIIADMRNHRQLLTRGNLLAVKGLQLHYDELHEEMSVFAAEQYYANDKLDMLIKSQECNENYDRLVGAAPHSRSLDDVVPNYVLDSLYNRVRHACADVVLYANKLVAHAATPESRSWDNNGDIKITLGKVWNAFEILCGTAGFIGIRLLNGGSQILSVSVPSSMFHFANQVLPSVENPDRQMMEMWEAYGRKYRQLYDKDLDYYLPPQPV